MLWRDDIDPLPTACKGDEAKMAKLGKEYDEVMAIRSDAAKAKFERDYLRYWPVRLPHAGRRTQMDALDQTYV